MRPGITAETIRAWQTIAAGLAQVLEQYGTLEATRQAWAGAVSKLRDEHRQAHERGRPAAFRARRSTPAIGAACRSGIAQIRAVSDGAQEQVRRVVGELESLTARSAELRQHVRVAEALITRDPSAWRDVHPDTWDGLLAPLRDWAAAWQVAKVEVGRRRSASAWRIRPSTPPSTVRSASPCRSWSGGWPWGSGTGPFARPWPSWVREATGPTGIAGRTCPPKRGWAKEPGSLCRTRSIRGRQKDHFSTSRLSCAVSSDHRTACAYGSPDTGFRSSRLCLDQCG